MLFELKGSLPFGVYSKDIILYIISKIGVDGARYQAMEYCGDGLKSLTMEAPLHDHQHGHRGGRQERH